MKMNTVKSLAALVLFSLLYFTGCTNSRAIVQNTANLKPARLDSYRFLGTWANGKTVLRYSVEDIDSAGYKLRNMSFYTDSVSAESRLLSFNDADYPIAIMPLKDDSGNLLTIWMSGVSYRVRIFSFYDNNVNKVLDIPSKSYPELFYENKETGDLSILTVNTDWVKNKKTKEREEQPVSATLYRLKGRQYISVPNISWTKRFSPVK